MTDAVCSIFSRFPPFFRSNIVWGGGITRTLFAGRGIAIWKGSHIHIHHNIIHHCPNSGIRVDKGDYCSIEDNVVYNNTWWSSSGESAIV